MTVSTPRNLQVEIAGWLQLRKMNFPEFHRVSFFVGSLGMILGRFSSGDDRSKR